MKKTHIFSFLVCCFISSTALALTSLGHCELSRLKAHVKCHKDARRLLSSQRKSFIKQCTVNYSSKMQHCIKKINSRNPMLGCALLPPPTIGVKKTLPNQKKLANCFSVLMDKIDACLYSARKMTRANRQPFYIKCVKSAGKTMYQCGARYQAPPAHFPPHQRPMFSKQLPWQASKNKIQHGDRVYACLSGTNRKTAWHKGVVRRVDKNTIKVKFAKVEYTVPKQFVISRTAKVTPRYPTQLQLNARKKTILPVLYAIAPFLEQWYKDKEKGVKLTDSALMELFKQQVTLPKWPKTSYKFLNSQLFLDIKLKKSNSPLKLKLYTTRDKTTKTNWQCSVLSPNANRYSLPEICQLQSNNKQKTLFNQTSTSDQ